MNGITKKGIQEKRVWDTTGNRKQCEKRNVKHCDDTQGKASE